MRSFLQLLFFFLISNITFCQSGFQFLNKKSKVIIPFQLENNLIIFPIEINGVKMNFLLDTGVEETILFSLEEKDELKLYNVEQISLRGLGSLETIQGLKSTGNILKSSNLQSQNETVIIVLDESFNFSSSIGINVNGIIGYKFFKDLVVEINYKKKQLVVRQNLYSFKKLKSYQTLPILLQDNKPYLQTQIQSNNIIENAKLLIDTGSSDALWLFKDKLKNIKVPPKNYNDFLGRGFSGEIYGSRAYLQKFSLANFNFSDILTAFPDTIAYQKSSIVKDRVGSVGAEICKRFNIIFDYPNNKLYLKKNSNFKNIFSYNKSGLEIQHAGQRLIQQEEKIKLTAGVEMNFGTDRRDIKYKFELKPNFEVVAIRKDSPSDKAGLLKGDLILTINGIQSYRYKLQEINQILKDEEGKTIRLQIERKKKILKIEFKLQNLL